MAKKIKTKTKSTVTSNVQETIIDVPLLTFARKKYYEYGISVLEDRAFPDFRDGMAPVNRRLLWAMYELGVKSNSKHVKSARVIGDTLGKYHPHGDTSCYGALVKMTNTNTALPLCQGDGNWGTLSDKSAAAMRYTEVRLSKFSDEVLFNKFYTPVIEMIPNYDGSLKEPMLLPALLPVALINGRFGIAPGAQTNVPICEYKSVLKALHAIFSGEELTSKFLYKTLRFRSTYGGQEGKLATDEDMENRRRVFKTPRGRVVLKSSIDYDPKTRTAIVTKFARDSDMESLINKLSDFEGVARASDDSSTKDLYGRLAVKFKQGYTEAQYTKLLSAVTKELSSAETYTLNMTEAYKDETGQGKAKVVPMSITSMFKAWITWRTELERKACTYWIAEDDREIRRLDLLAQAVDLIDFIVSLLKNTKLDTDGVYKAYSKKASVTHDEAKYVLSRPIITLRKLDKADLLAQRKVVEANKSKLEKRRKNPHAFMAEQIKGWVNLAP